MSLNLGCRSVNHVRGAATSPPQRDLNEPGNRSAPFLNEYNSAPERVLAVLGIFRMIRWTVCNIESNASAINDLRLKIRMSDGRPTDGTSGAHRTGGVELQRLGGNCLPSASFKV